MRTILERAGLRVVLEDDEEQRPVLIVPEESEAKQARVLEARVLDHYARRATRDVEAALRGRARWSRRLLIGGAVMLAMGLLVALS